MISHWQIGIGDKPGGVGVLPRKFWKLSALRAFLEHLKQFLKHNNSSKICYFYYDKIFLAHFWYQGAAAPQYQAPVFLSTQVWQPLATRNFIALRGVWGPCTRKFWSLAFLILQIQNYDQKIITLHNRSKRHISLALYK